jgi:hypothetical protein
MTENTSTRENRKRTIVAAVAFVGSLEVAAPQLDQTQADR